MKLSQYILIILFTALFSTSAVQAQSIQGLGTDPLTNDQYSCVAFLPSTQNYIELTDKKGKKKKLKINVAKEKVAGHLSDAKKRVKEVTKTRKGKQKRIDKIYSSQTGAIHVVELAKLEKEVNILNARIAQLSADAAILAQLSKLIVECKNSLPYTHDTRLFSGILPPGVPGAGYYYVFIIHVFSPNVASNYCAHISSRDQQPLEEKYPYKVLSNICAKFGIPECFDPSKEAGLLIRNYVGPNRPGTCKKPGDICDLSSALADANELLASLSIYGIVPVNSSASNACDGK